MPICCSCISATADYDIPCLPTTASYLSGHVAAAAVVVAAGQQQHPAADARPFPAAEGYPAEQHLHLYHSSICTCTIATINIAYVTL